MAGALLLALAGCEPSPPAGSVASSPPPAASPAAPAPQSAPAAKPAAVEPAPGEPPGPDCTRETLAGGDFEAGEAGWQLGGAATVAALSADAAFAGAAGLRLDSPENDLGVKIWSARQPAREGLSYRLVWRGRVLSGGGTNVYLVFFGADGAELQRDEGRVGADRGAGWLRHQIKAVPPSGAASLAVLVERPGWRSPRYRVDLDAFELWACPLVIAPPWAGTYKLRADDTARLTAADVVGPDGRVYPDFTYAGVPGGIPSLPVAARIDELGAKPGEDITALLEATVAKVGAAGGGAVLIGEGDYFLDQPVMVFSDRVAIRGAGRDKTRLFFRYHVPQGEIRFFRVKPGDEIGQNGGIEFHANPKNLTALELRSGDKSLSRRTRADHWGNTFSLRVGGKQAVDALGAGPRTFTAIAEYEGGARVERTIELVLKAEWSGEPAPTQLGVFSFVGRGNVSGRLPLTADGRRGDTAITLDAKHGLKAGDRITLVAPASERWRKLVGHSSHWQIQAQNLHEIVAVEGGRLTLNQPLRTAFAVEDGAHVQKVHLVSGSGIEDLTLEQVVVPGQGAPGPVIAATLSPAIEDLWTSGVIFSHAWGGWMKNVTVRNAGRNSAYFPLSKHIEVRDCLFDGAIFKGGGGTGYIGFDRTWDSLMDGVEARGMRHAPNNQWNASGNVVRNGRFLGSDGQWHAGWTLENLYENNFIDARGKGGSYGHGLYASGPTSGIHGPQGPRNVVYNNDVVSRLDGLHMLGGNEAWMILHNRFMVGSGRAVYGREKTFDHIIAGNVFVLRQAVEPAVFFGYDATGVELSNNVFYGVSGPLVGFAGGLTKLGRDEGNIAHAETPATPPARPTPAVPSIFQWQRDNLAALRAAQAAAAKR